MMASVEGNVDHLGPSPLMGWARSHLRPLDRLSVRVEIAGRAVGVVRADRHRPDLEAAGIGDGRHGFEMSIAANIDLSSDQAVRVCCDTTDQTIWRGTTGELTRRAADLNALRRNPLWAVNQIAIEGDHLRAGGYLVPAASSPVLHPVFTLNGEPFAEMSFPVVSPASAARLWFVPGYQTLGFSGRATIGSRSDTGTVIDCLDARTGKPLTDFGSFFAPPDFAQQLNRVPSGERMLRVQGNELADVHLLWGSTARARIDAVLRQHLGRDLRTFRSVLDWGCGCGRLTRHLTSIAGPQVTGADIDADNVEWCSEHIEGGTFVCLPLSPPSTLAASSFDLIIGLSVMTHLREQDQLDWLAELDRLATPDAVILLTVNADTAVWWSVPPLELMQEWADRGFSDRARDPALDGIIGDDSYYRATFHHEDYVQRVWGERFDIVTVLPAFSHIQDLVVMRKAQR